MTTIHYNRGAQQIRHVPIDRTGTPRRVTVATVQIVDLRESLGAAEHDVLAETPATVSAVTTTTTAASGPSTADPRRLSVTAPAGFRTSGVYLHEDTGSARQESIRVTVIDAPALEFTLANALRQNYVTGSTLTAIELEGTFPAAVADDEQKLDRGGGPFLSIWAYTIDAQQYVATQELWLTRYGIQPWVTADKVLQHLPGLGQQIGNAVTAEQAIAAATDDLLEHLQANGSWRRDPAYFRGNISADLAVRKWAIMYLLRGTRNDAAIDLADKYESKGLHHANNLTEGRPPTRTVAVDPVNEDAREGGEQAAAGGYFARS